MSSDLSASAIEFVPQTYRVPLLSASAPEFIPEKNKFSPQNNDGIKTNHNFKCSKSISSYSTHSQYSSFQNASNNKNKNLNDFINTKDLANTQDQMNTEDFMKANQYTNIHNNKNENKNLNKTEIIKSNKNLNSVSVNTKGQPQAKDLQIKTTKKETKAICSTTLSAIKNEQPKLSWSSIVKKTPNESLEIEKSTKALTGVKAPVTEEITGTQQNYFKKKKNYTNIKNNITSELDQLKSEHNSDLKVNFCSQNERKNISQKDNGLDENIPQRQNLENIVSQSQTLLTEKNTSSSSLLKKTNKKKSSNLRVSFESNLYKNEDKFTGDVVAKNRSSKKLIDFQAIQTSNPESEEKVWLKEMSHSATVDASFPSTLTSNVATPLSYSSIVKKIPVSPITPIKNCVDDEKPTSTQLSPEERKKRLKEKKLKRKLKVKEKKARLAKENPKVIEVSKKSSKKEVMLDFGCLLDQLNSQKDIKKQRKVVSIGVISVVSGLAKRNTSDGKRKTRDKGGASSEGLRIKRGKMRETPKKKKPTLLKKIIKLERERKRLINAAKQEPVQEKQSVESTDLSATEKLELFQKEDSKIDIVKEPHLIEDSCPNVCQDSNGPTDFQIDTVCQNTSERKVSDPNVTKLCSLPDYVREKIHSRKFREYCNHLLSDEINNLTQSLLLDLIKYQDRVYHENRTKFKQKRRYVLGLREVLKHLKVKKLKAIIVAPNIERISCEGGIDDYLTNILSLCNEDSIPVIFAMNRHTLGKTMKKNAPASVVGIFSYDGAQDKFKELMLLVEKARMDYKNKVKLTTQQFITNDFISKEVERNENKTHDKTEVKSGRHRQLNPHRNEQTYFIYPSARLYQGHQGYRPIKNNYNSYTPGQTNYYYHSPPPSVIHSSIHYNRSLHNVESHMNPSLQITEAEYLKKQILEKFYS
ncbi:selenocysteine insertion sequence-binding protein 2 isoform X3 [Hydra vulgaris]|uniref:Selenocysteine insertion sequence-binding protein 2 isoform X3 n=1 Tax=Hydra vulgaris TaxID=6087 RepID=A0ABM4CEL4_HYDVU